MKNNPSIFAIFAGVFIVLVMVVVLQADEWNDKPVLCGTEEEIMPLLANKEEVRYLQATQITTVKEEDAKEYVPDE